MLDLAWRPRAQLDRESIAIYLGLERGMPQAALDAIKGIDAALETVRTFPDAGGHFTDDHLEHEYRTTLAGPYIIYYRYNATTLTVYRIMHQRQSIDTYSLIEYQHSIQNQYRLPRYNSKTVDLNQPSTDQTRKNMNQKLGKP